MIEFILTCLFGILIIAILGLAVFGALALFMIFNK